MSISRYALTGSEAPAHMNTGGKNYDEEKGVVAHNSVHHSAQYPSQVTVTVVKHAAGASAPASGPASGHVLQ